MGYSEALEGKLYFTSPPRPILLDLVFLVTLDTNLLDNLLLPTYNSVSSLTCEYSPKFRLIQTSGFIL